MKRGQQNLRKGRKLFQWSIKKGKKMGWGGGEKVRGRR